MQRYLVPILQPSPPPSSERSTSVGAIQQFWLFLERNGSHLISLEVEDETEAAAIQAAHDFCEVNELSQAGDPFYVAPFLFVRVDPADKDLRAFYSWDETPPGTQPSCEAWRPFLWVRGGGDGSADLDPWGVNGLLKEIRLGENPSLHAYAVLHAYLRSTTATKAP